MHQIILQLFQGNALRAVDKSLYTRLTGQPPVYLSAVSLLSTSAHADSDRPTQRCASSDVQITVSATGVLRLLDHAFGTRCQSIYRSATVSGSLNGCRRPICSVFGTAALCDALVRSAVQKSSYLPAYLLTYY